MKRLWFLIALPALFLQGCFTFSSYQSARIVEPENPRMTLSLSRNNWAEDDQRFPGWTVFEVQGRRGTKSKRIDLGAKVSTLFADERIFGFVVGVDGRIALWPDHLTLALPWSILVGDVALETIDFNPGLIGSIRVNEQLEINGAASTYVLSGIGSGHSFNLGLAWSTDPRKWVLRPEVGWLVLEDVESQYVQFGIGVELPLGGKSGKRRSDVYAE